ncbi:hypothetical protein BerOc1_02074 [Pseudodesulfovibrio hydrargyri]|uniref:DUF362 domain-containing protein n=1 Tax=Pseudodesulfovibrio hydrargyri TaxID=2125990 RepID=A0A1J5N5P2_9BACT|nr:DUF362 domain-containing protein [Pseudodesulfovibrio hydrargyri]OIQ50144.1 hypothetical protein BerOc1_02074 [Pseudodesulfovibrio hydrargyri]
MDRRDFLKSGIVAGSALALGGVTGLWSAAASAAGPQRQWDLVAVRGGEPDEMFDSAIAAYGGMGTFVPKGARVVIKPNIGWDVSPERGGNTNPRLIGRIAEHCFDAGAREVVVFDHSCDNWRQCYLNSGIEAAVKGAGGKMVSADSKGYYREVEVPGGKRLNRALVHEALLDADVFLNVPVLKDHSSSVITASMKNLMGVVWDRWYFHRNDLHQCIADIASLRRPDLTVVDAYNVMMRNGPRGVSESDVVRMRALVASTDFVAADAAGARLYGVDPAEVRHIGLAADMGLGRMDLKDLSINRIKLG